MNSRILFIILAAASLSLGSCSVVSKIGISRKSGTTEVRTGTVKPDKDTSPATVLPQTPTENIQIPQPEELTGGEWTVASVGELNINAEDDVPYVNFDSKGKFYVSDGCNVINGRYMVLSDGHMAFSQVLSTQKYCPDIEYSAPIAAVFSDNSSYVSDCRKIGRETYLYLRNSRGNVMLTLRRHNMEFLNGEWRVTSAEGKKINDPEANLFFDIPEMKVHGNSGCNFFNGEIYIDPNRPNAIDISNISLTATECKKSDQERRIVVALEMSASAVSGKHDDTVLLLDKKGKEVMTLRRVNNEK